MKKKWQEEIDSEEEEEEVTAEELEKCSHFPRTFAHHRLLHTL